MFDIIMADLAEIKMLAMDVDGVLTDGTIVVNRVYGKLRDIIQGDREMHAQGRNLTRKTSLLLLVAASLFAVGGCVAHYQGYLSRPVIVTVTDADTTQAVSSATVRLRASDDDSMQRFLDNRGMATKEKYENVTDLEGKAELLVWFQSGGKHTIFLWFRVFEKGGFGLSRAGTLEVDAEGYERFEREFGLLTGERWRSVNDKSPVKVHVKLVPSN